MACRMPRWPERLALKSTPLRSASLAQSRNAGQLNGGVLQGRSHMDSHAPYDLKITEEAADWLVELKASGASHHAEFFEWVRRSPEHVREFLAVTGLARKLRNVDPQRRIDVNELLGDEE